MEYPNFTYYLYALWNLSSPLAMLFLFLGILKSFEKRKESDIILLTWFLFLYIFLSLFPQHRFKIFSTALPAFSLLIARGFDWFKDKSALILIFLLLIVAGSLLNSYNTITGSCLAYKKAAEVIINDYGKKVLASDAGKIRFYLRDIDVPTEFCDDINAAIINGVEELKKRGYTHIVMDYRAGRESLCDGNLKKLRDLLLESETPIATIENNNLYVDEFNILRWNMVKNFPEEKAIKFENMKDKEYRVKMNISEEDLTYNDEYRLYISYSYLDDDPNRDYIHVYRI